MVLVHFFFNVYSDLELDPPTTVSDAGDDTNSGRGLKRNRENIQNDLDRLSTWSE